MEATGETSPVSIAGKLMLPPSALDEIRFAVKVLFEPRRRRSAVFHVFRIFRILHYVNYYVALHVGGVSVSEVSFCSSFS